MKVIGVNFFETQCSRSRYLAQRTRERNSDKTECDYGILRDSRNRLCCYSDGRTVGATSRLRCLQFSLETREMKYGSPKRLKQLQLLNANCYRSSFISASVARLSNGSSRAHWGWRRRDDVSAMTSLVLIQTWTSALIRWHGPDLSQHLTFSLPLPGGLVL